MHNFYSYRLKYNLLFLFIFALKNVDMNKIMIEHLFVGNTDSFDKISISYRSLFQTGRRGFKSYGRNNI